MDRRVEVGIRRLEAQQVAVGARLAPGERVLVAPLAEAQRDGEAEAPLDLAHDVGDELPRQPRILARLHDERAVAERLRRRRALEDLAARQPVALRAAGAGAQAAVEAAAHAVVRDLGEAAQVDVVADPRAPRRVRLGPQRLESPRIALRQPGEDLAARHRDAPRNASRAAGNGPRARSKIPSE